MGLDELAAVSGAAAATRSRNRKAQLLAEALRRMAPAEVEIGVSYLVGTLPQGRIGLGPALVHGAAQVEPVAHASLSLAEVQAALERIAAIGGPGSATARRRQLADLFRRSTAAEQAFLAKLLVGELRQGALEGVLVDALARAARVPAEAVRRAVMLAGTPAPVAHALLSEGAGGLARFALTLFDPVRPMLAQTASDPKSALDALGEAALEYKLDGVRVQLHKDGDRIRVFSRRMNDISASVPELVEAAGRWPVDRVVLDGEAIALRDDGTPQPFQVTMRRFGRKADVEAMRAQLPLTTLFFDCLHRDGDDLLDRPLAERSAAGVEVLPDGLWIPRLVTADAAQAEAFLEQALARGHEGVLAKSLQAPYAAGSRGSAWLKIKPAHTLDLVVLAAEWGSGRRQGWLSNLHLGARDATSGGLVMLGKTFKGLTDVMLQWQTEQLLAREIGRDRHTVYVRPDLVVEIAFDGIQASSRYPGGLALRFARVKRYRDDKRAEDADTIDMVRALYKGGAGG